MSPRFIVNDDLSKVDKKFVKAFDYIINSEAASDLWKSYDSPVYKKLPIIVNPKTYKTYLLQFEKEILNDGSCIQNKISQEVLDSLYLASVDTSNAFITRREYGPIEILSNVSFSSFNNYDVLVIIFSKPFRNLLEASLFHSKSMNDIDGYWVFGTGCEYLFCFDKNNNIVNVYSNFFSYN